MSDIDRGWAYATLLVGGLFVASAGTAFTSNVVGELLIAGGSRIIQQISELQSDEIKEKSGDCR